MLAGYLSDGPAAREGLADRFPQVRASALSALTRMGALGHAEIAAGLGDPDQAVRRRAAEIAARIPGAVLGPMLADPAPAVVEMVAWALGERGDPDWAPALASTARSHPDPLCREAAVAAIGALAAVTAQNASPTEGLAAVLDALDDRPAVRRRAVLALAAFEGAEVRAALRRAATDRDWQVRQVAEDLLAANPG